MSLKITHKYSTAAGTPPASGDIDVGEVAINAADAELYTKDSAGNIRKFQNTTTGTADGVQFTQAGTGAVQRTVESKLKDVVSVKDFGAVGDGVTDDFSKVLAAWTYCLAEGKDLYFPAGTYVSQSFSFPIGRIDGSPPSSLLDCKNITVFGDGPATVLKTISATGADVLQINGAKNLRIKDLTVTASLTGTTGAGSSGVSVTGGGENLSFTRIYASNLPYVDKTTYLDGGKAFTLQLSGFATSVGSITFTDCAANGCVYGFEHNPVLDDFVGETANIAFNNCVAENCWYGFLSTAPAAGVALPEGFNGGISFVDVRSINCQHGAVLGRNHGGIFKFSLKTTKTAANLKLDPNGTAWSTTLNTSVDGLVCQYAHNSTITANGYLTDVEYKARIGGTSAGSSGLIGSTFNSKIYLDIGGTASIADVAEIDSGGNTLRESLLQVSATTSATSLPAAFYLPVNLNHIEHVATTLQAPTAAAAFASLKFPAVFSDVADANTLDDYEEGTWTPLLFDTGLTNKGATYVNNNGKYTKIGDVVYFNVYIALSGLGTLTTGSAAFIGGLPFASRTQAGNISAVTVGFASSLALSSAATLNARIGLNESYITLAKWNAASTTGNTSLTVGEVSASGVLSLSGFYFT